MGLGFGVWGLWSGVEGLEFGVQGVGSGVEGMGFDTVSTVKVPVPDPSPACVGVQGLNPKPQTRSKIKQNQR